VSNSTSVACPRARPERDAAFFGAYIISVDLSDLRLCAIRTHVCSPFPIVCTNVRKIGRRTAREENAQTEDVSPRTRIRDVFFPGTYSGEC
jgi:hypothetical protein